MKKGEESQAATLGRCPWCGESGIYMDYHDREWGEPLRDNQRLFEALILDGAQAGLSWLTILKRREAYRRAFDGMRAETIARYGEKEIQRLMGNPLIIRNRRKIVSAIGNARAYVTLMEGPVSFSSWLWNWVDGEPIIHYYRTQTEVPAQTELSARISQELKGRGFSFVGPTIIYAYMQAVGMVNDHLVTCFKHPATCP
ncbi:MAG: DNA-3-methyladenine glycosylase I [Spirochaetaceae bacterium]|jgi:DNA-3-methyladenine glycosylase I|nr:DNA-3-methyladenine glycosylase I [Spirochaetaceae bacterium]